MSPFAKAIELSNQNKIDLEFKDLLFSPTKELSLIYEFDYTLTQERDDKGAIINQSNIDKKFAGQTIFFYERIEGLLNKIKKDIPSYPDSPVNPDSLITSQLSYVKALVDKISPSLFMPPNATAKVYTTLPLVYTKAIFDGGMISAHPTQKKKFFVVSYNNSNRYFMGEKEVSKNSFYHTLSSIPGLAIFAPQFTPYTEKNELTGLFTNNENKVYAKPNNKI